MVDVNKNEIFFINQVKQNDLGKTIDMAYNQNNTQPNNLNGNAETMFSQQQPHDNLNQTDKKF